MGEGRTRCHLGASDLAGGHCITETSGGAESSTQTTNPIGFLPEWLGYVALLGIVAILFGGAVSLVIKRRRAVGAERAQFTWVVFAFVLLTSAVVLTFLYIFISIGVGAGDPGDAAWGPVYVMMILFPLSFGIAVLHYRLYEIDRIVSRTVTYAVVVGLLAAAFFGVVALMSSLLPTESSDLAVAGRHWWWPPCSIPCVAGSTTGSTAVSTASAMTRNG